MIGLSYVFYGWVGWSYCLLLLATTTGGLRRRGLGPPGAQRPGAAHRHERGRRRAARDPGLVQVLRLRLGQRRQPDPRPRDGSGRAAAPGGAAHRHLVLHLHGHQLRGRHLPAPARAGPPARLRLLHLVLPAPAGRPDRAGHRAAAPDPPAPGPRERRLRPRLLADHGRVVQEGRHLLVRVDRDRPAGLHVAEPALGARGDLRRLGLRGADLLRLQRLHRHRHRPGPAARLPLPAELRRALHGAQPAGLLAPLAHDALALAARLPLHPAGGQRGWRGATRCATS